MSMPRRLLCIALLLHSCWWFGWFAAAHQRGAIAIPGAAQAKATSGCCKSHGDEGGQKPPRDEPTKRCYVCYLVAKMDVPAVVDLSLGRPQPLEVVDVPGGERAVSRPAFNVYL